MKNKIYYLTVLALAILLVLLKIYVFSSFRFPFIAGGIFVMYVWCKDIFTGTGWFERSKPTLVNPAGNTSKQFTETLVGESISVNEKQGYLKLMHELVAPKYFPKLEPFINALKTFDESNDAFEPLYSLGDFTDEHSIAFISLLDWKSAIEDLIWRIKNALKHNYGVEIELPSETLWEPRASVSYDNVFKTYDDALRAHGFQLGFIQTGGDDYAIMVFRTNQKLAVEDGAKLTGYGYYEITSQ